MGSRAIEKLCIATAWGGGYEGADGRNAIREKWVNRKRTNYKEDQGTENDNIKKFDYRGLSRWGDGGGATRKSVKQEVQNNEGGLTMGGFNRTKQKYDS